MGESFEKLTGDMLILEGNLMSIEEDLSYLNDLDSLLMELRRIKEENKRGL